MRDSEKIEHPGARDIMTPRIYMLRPNQTFAELIELMDEKLISAVVIHDDTMNDYNIISHSDIIRFMHKHQCKFEDLSKEPLHQMMTGPMGSVDIEASVDDIIRYMNDSGFKRVLVKENGKAVGIISMKDIIKWSSDYFQKANPLVVMIMENKSGVCLAKYICSTVDLNRLNKDLIEIFGSAINSISCITEEVFKETGNLRIVRKDKYTILFEPHEAITGILICDNNSIDLRRKLHAITDLFLLKYQNMLNSKQFKEGYYEEINITDICELIDPKIKKE